MLMTVIVVLIAREREVYRENIVLLVYLLYISKFAVVNLIILIILIFKIIS